jgi:hypothetical protein
MSDLATVLLALGPATITGLVGYFAVRFQRDTSKAETEAATERLRVEYEEKERARRQDAYHDFLILLEEHDAMMTGYAPRDDAAYRDFRNRFYAGYQGIHLFGAEEVRDAVGGVAGALGDLALHAQETAEGKPLVQAMAAVYSAHVQEITAQTALLTMAMRDDVAVHVPELAPSLLPSILGE